MNFRAGRRGRALCLLSFLLLALLGSVGSLRADDRDLLRASAGDPYVFILLDTSGSMHWRVGNTLPTLRSDSPESKMYQAKQALYQVVENLDNINFGFGTFNQDQLRVVAKHWLYVADEDGVVVNTDSSGDPLWIYPAAGDEHVFGRIFDCNPFSRTGDGAAGCSSNAPARLYVDWEARRAQLYSKLGTDGDTPTTFYIRTSIPGNDNKRYSVTFTRISGNYGDETMEVQVRVRNTNSSFFDQTATVTFRKQQDFLAWDNFPQPHDGSPNSEEGFFDQMLFNDIPSASDVQALFQSFHSTCTGWDPNTDSGSEFFSGVNLKAPTTTVNGLSYGDVIPLNWNDRNVERIQERLAPNLLLGESTPDFSVSRYFSDSPSGGVLDLRNSVRNAGGTVVVPWGSTPLGRSINNFRSWFQSWRTTAAANDPDFACRDVYLLILTDGLETCSSSSYPGTQAAFLKGLGVNTYAIGFGVPASAGGDTLDDIASAGGTGEPFRPDDVDELVSTLEFIFSQIQQEAASFASAAVPSVQANVADKIFLTSFTPIPANSVWDGHVDAYLKPLPQTVDGLPDRDRVCEADDTSACRLWDAGEEILNQAPDSTNVDGNGVLTDPKLGGGEGQRRVLYTHQRNNVNRVPLGRALFWADDNTPETDWHQLLESLEILSNPAGATPAELLMAKSEAKEVLKDTYLIKEGEITITDENGNEVEEMVTYLLGDIFHSDPLVLSGPDNAAYFSEDFKSNEPPTACDDAVNPDPGYRCFVEKHFYRRKMLIFGANDGQMHGFDAGILREEVDGDEVDRLFDNGTGREIFSIIPQSALVDVKELTTTSRQRFIVDGPLVADDVFLDPKHNGLPTASEREWRSVIFAGLREGGRSVLALDVTQPDELVASVGNPLPNGGRDRFNIPRPLTGTDGTVDDFVPSCWEESAVDANSPADADCGTLPFPQMLWEFDDVDPATLLTRDEDGNGRPDLGFTWSKPNTGVIRIEDQNGDLDDRFVVIFGGGLDPAVEEVAPGTVGNWIYILDAETGQILYKKSVVGAVPGEPAAVNTDGDLYLDTIYFGTKAGYLYKMDVSDPFPLGADDRVADDPDGDGVGAWNPFQIFYTGGRPIFFPPSVFFSSSLNLYGLAYATGDREDLWRPDDYNNDGLGDGGRFYVLLDSNFSAGTTGLPRTAANLTLVDLAANPTTSNLLAQGGWMFNLLAGERAINPTVTISGVTFFTTYLPLDAPPPDPNGTPVCGRAGESRSYVVSAINGNGFLPADNPGDPSPRYFSVGEFVTNPFLDSGTTKNRLDPDEENPPLVADNCPPQLLNTLKDLQPRTCRYGTARRRLQVVRQDTGLQCVAPIPVCIQPHNWTGF